MTCHLRDLRECACTPQECKAARPASTAPTHRASVKDILMTAAWVGSIAFFIAFVVAARAEPYLKTQQLIAQENVSHVAR